MTGGAPLTTADYNAQNLHILAALLLAKQGVLHLTEWSTLTVPAIAAGVSIMHGGNLYMNENSNLAITDPGVVNGRVYIQISDAGGGTLDAEFTNSAVGFSWNNAYQGFYNAGGDQLMPYVLYKTASGYNKFTSDRLVNKFLITSKLIITETGISIGNWNMDLTDEVNIAMSDIVVQMKSSSTTAFLEQTINLEVYIRNDTLNTYTLISLQNSSSASGGGRIDYSPNAAANSYNLARTIAGMFDNASYDDAAIIRGYINHIYWI